MIEINLAGVGVLVTRPREQASALASAIRKVGGLPHLYPAVEIVKMKESDIFARLEQLADMDLIVFVSPTAVHAAVKPVAKRFGHDAGPGFAAVGQTTASELTKNGVRRVIVPDAGSGSEALLRRAELQTMAGQSVLVIRGEGGSDKIVTSMKQRGADVSILECYCRKIPEPGFSEPGSLIDEGCISAWTATSGEILDNLMRLAGKHCERLREMPLFVNHPHIASSACKHEIRSVFVCNGGDSGLVDGLTTWFCRLRPELT